MWMEYNETGISGTVEVIVFIVPFVVVRWRCLCLCDELTEDFSCEDYCSWDIFAMKRTQLSIWVTYNVKICKATDREEIETKASKVKEKMSVKDVIREKKLILGDKKPFFLLTISCGHSLCVNSE